jgi:hypothetical protein
MGDHDVQVKFGASIGELIEGVDRVKESIEELAAPIHGMIGAFGEMGEALLAAFAVEKVSEFFEKFAEMGAQTLKFATLLGTNTEEIGALDLVAKGSDTTLRGLTQSMERLGMTLAQAGGGSEKAKAGLEALGIEAKEFQALRPEAQLQELAEKFSVLKDGIDKDAIAMAVMGRAGAEMIPLFNRGAEGIQSFFEMGRRAGSIMTHEVAEGFEATHIKLIELNASFTGLGLTIATGLKPAFDGIVSAITRAVEGLNNWIKESAAAKVAGEALIIAGRSMATAWAVSVATLQTLGEVWRLIASQILNDLTMISKVIVGVFTFDKSAITGAWAEMSEKNKQTYGDAAANMKRITDDMLGSIRSAWSDEAHHEEEIHQTRTARLVLEDKNATAAALAAVKERIKLADMEYAETAEQLGSQAKVHAITEQQKTQALLAALDVRRAAQMAAIADELAIAKQGTKEYQAILNEKLTLEKKFQSDRSKVIDEGFQRDVSEWSASLSQVQGAWDSQLKGLIDGTKSFAAAMKSIFSDLVLDIIKQFEKAAIEKLALGLAGSTGTSPGAGGLGGLAFTGLGNLFSGGMSAMLKPVGGMFGGAAVAAGGGGGFGGMLAGLAALLPFFDEGTNEVRATGLAVVHAGEQIRPAQSSGPFTGGSAGDTHLHFNVSAMDAGGVQAFFNANGRQIANILSGVMNSNPSFS